MSTTRYVADGPLIGNLGRWEGGRFRLHPTDTRPASAPAPAPTPTAPAWKAGEAVKKGDLRSHGGTVYAVIQPHTTQTGWEPPAVPALWKIA